MASAAPIYPPVWGICNAGGPYLDIKAYAKLFSVDHRFVTLLHFENPTTMSARMRREKMRGDIESARGWFKNNRTPTEHVIIVANCVPHTDDESLIAEYGGEFTVFYVGGSGGITGLVRYNMPPKPDLADEMQQMKI